MTTYLDPSEIDSATKANGFNPEFKNHYDQKKGLDKPTFFIKGNHENFDFLKEHENKEILPNLTYLTNQQIFRLGSLNIGIMGGNYAPSKYNITREKLGKNGNASKYFNFEDINFLKDKSVDVLLTHDAPENQVLPGISKGKGCNEIKSLIEKLQPKYAFHGHYHTPCKYRTMIGDTKIVGLPLITNKSIHEKPYYILEV